MAREMPKKMMACMRDLARLPMSPSAMAPMDIPRARTDTTSAPRSCTQPTMMAPRTTHSMAGSQPQITAMAGPSMGDRPVTEA